MDLPGVTQDEKVIKLDAPRPSSTKKTLIITLTSFAVITGLLFFVIGFIIGNINLRASQTKTPRVGSPSASVEGWSVFLDEQSLFYISHPKDWKAEKHSKNDYDGVRIEADKGYVDLWLLVDQPYFLGEKHQKAIMGEEDIQLTIADKTIPGTQYNYKAGNFFTVIVLSSTTTTPQVTFWAEADDEKAKEETQKIIESFKFLN